MIIPLSPRLAAAVVALGAASLAPAQLYLDASARFPPEADIVTPGGSGVDFLTNTSDVDLVDVDGDGDLDAFVVDGTANIAGRPNRLYLNDGHGRFTDASSANLPPSANVPFDPGPANSVRAAAGDVDGDGDLDLAIANLGDNALLLNDGSGVFADASDRLPAPPTGPLAGPLAAFNNISVGVDFADFTGDGRLDLYFVNELPPIPGVGPGGSPNLLYVQQADGTFADESAVRLPALSDATINFAAFDVDGDGDLDILEANIGQNRLLLNDGTGAFADATAARLPVDSSSTRGLALGDLDGDGDLDFVTANSNAEQNEVFLNDGTGAFAAAPGLLPDADDTSSDVLLVDVNLDGRLDVIFANSALRFFGPGIPPAPTPAANPVYLQRRDGSFRVPNRSLLSDDEAPSFELEAGDVNGDGLLDIAVANANAAPEQLLLRRRPPPPPAGVVTPVIECVAARGPRAFTARFGYTNTAERAYYIPAGSLGNRLIGGTTGQVQPVVYLPGGTMRHPGEIFSYDFPFSAGWLLNGRYPNVSPYTISRFPGCSQEELVGRGDGDDEAFEASLAEATDLRVAPTLVGESLVLTYGLGADADAIGVRVYNSTGRVVDTQLENGSAPAGEYGFEVTTGHLAAGLYYVELTYTAGGKPVRQVAPFSKQ